MTREELAAVVETVLDAPAPWQDNGDRADTIMRAADLYASTAAGDSLRVAAEFFGMEPVNLDGLVRLPCT